MDDLVEYSNLAETSEAFFLFYGRVNSKKEIHL